MAIGHGVHDQLDAQYAGATGVDALLPGTADGSQNAYIAITPGASASFGTVSVTNLATIESATSYALVVALGNRLDVDPGDITLSLTADGTAFVSSSVSAAAIAEGTFSDFL